MLYSVFVFSLLMFVSQFFDVFDYSHHQDHLEIMDHRHPVLHNLPTANPQDRWVVPHHLCHLQMQDQEGWLHLLILLLQVSRRTVNSQLLLNEDLRHRKEATEHLRHRLKAIMELLLHRHRAIMELPLLLLKGVMELPLQLQAVMELHHRRTDLCPHLQAEAMVLLRHQDAQRVACLLRHQWEVHAPLRHLLSTDKI